MFGKLHLISPPDHLFNNNPSYLLVKPSKTLKIEFQQILSESVDDVNIFIFDDVDTDIAWLLTASNQVGFIVIDIDNCKEDVIPFLGLLLMHPNSCYISNNDDIPWGLINRNRIFDIGDLIGYMIQTIDDDEEDYESDDEDDDEDTE
jgi:hypothetical protein